MRRLPDAGGPAEKGDEKWEEKRAGEKRNRPPSTPSAGRRSKRLSRFAYNGRTRDLGSQSAVRERIRKRGNAKSSDLAKPEKGNVIGSHLVVMVTRPTIFSKLFPFHIDCTFSPLQLQPREQTFFPKKAPHFIRVFQEFAFHSCCLIRNR